MLSRIHVEDIGMEHDEGELKSEEDSQTTTSEGFTTDGEDDSSSNEHSDADKSPKEETPWERGLRLARERAERAKLMRQSDANLEEKKLNLVVVAPDPSEDLAYADICDSGRPSVSDVFWNNYHKFAIIGATQLTCKRSLPTDLVPPSEHTMSVWRRQVTKGSQTPSSSESSPVSSRFGSRCTSLSSLAGSVLLAATDLILADDSDREEAGRRRRRSHSNSSSGASSSGSRSRSRSSTHGQRGVVGKQRQSSSRSSLKGKRKRGTYSESSASRSSRSPVRPHKAGGGVLSPRGRDSNRGFRGRRPAPLAYSIGGAQRQPPQEFTGFGSRNATNESGHGGRDAPANRWHDSSSAATAAAAARSPSDRPPPMPSERPVKRPWVAEPPRLLRDRPLAVAQPLRRVSPPPPRPRERSRSRSGSVAHPQVTDRDERRRRTLLHEPPEVREAPWSSQGRDARLPQSPPPASRKRPAGARRKSRSPFADSYFGNPQAPSAAAKPSVAPAAEAPRSFEETVPLLAGAVNPAPPPPSMAGDLKALPSMGARPGVKLKLTSRSRVAPSRLPLSGSGQKPLGGINASPVSSASNRSRSASPRGSKRPRRSSGNGYVAVSPDGFDSPPRQPPPTSQRPQNQPQPSSSRGAEADYYGSSSTSRGRTGGHGGGGGGGGGRRFHGDEERGARDRYGRADDRRGRGGGGDYHNRGDRYSRGGPPAPAPGRYRDGGGSSRRPPPLPSSSHHERRSGPDRRPQGGQPSASYDRGRQGRDYGRYREAQEREAPPSRSYGRHGRSRHEERPVRSRSPFEDRGRRNPAAPSSAEARLDELQKRLSMIDGRIAELGASRR